jgi:hypothetical protein
MDAGVAVVGDSGLLVAETPGAPVELRVVEPAIGGSRSASSARSRPSSSTPARSR